MNTTFAPTHRITFTPATGEPRIDDVRLVDGAAYTRAEWESESAADWELVDGAWRFQGQATPGGANGTVEVTILDARAFEHTLPTGVTVTFTLAVEDTEEPRAIVGYPADLDLSRLASDVAYPVAAIETAMSAACGRRVEFARCTSNGCDADSWEVWTFRDAD